MTKDQEQMISDMRLYVNEAEMYIGEGRFEMAEEVLVELRDVAGRLEDDISEEDE